MRFDETDISESIIKGLSEMGFETMTPIQEQAIPVLMEGNDMVGLAQTGTGKTTAFGVPSIESVNPASKKIQALILCPTRELAMQDASEIEKMAKYVKGLNVLAIAGGQDIIRQIRDLKKGAHIVIGTPGRIMDHMRRGTLSFDGLRMLVLDEADEMLDMGFREDIETICEAMPKERQTALFSATMPEEIAELAGKYQRNPVTVEVSRDELTVPLIKQSYYVVKGKQKDEALCRLIDYMCPKRALIFCNTKRKVDELSMLLKRRGYSVEALHGDLAQIQRDRVMNLFREGEFELLLATDVAARGIDIDDVDIVFNYDLPQLMEYYVHRIGRTGRAGRKGKAVSIVYKRDRNKIAELEVFANTKIKEKVMPSYEDVMPIKANSNITHAIEFTKEQDLGQYREIIERRCKEEKIDPVEMAAILLREGLGEARDDMEIGEKTKDESKPRRSAKNKKTGNNRSSKNNRVSGGKRSTASSEDKLGKSKNVDSKGKSGKSLSTTEKGKLYRGRSDGGKNNRSGYVSGRGNRRQNSSSDNRHNGSRSRRRQG